MIRNFWAGKNNKGDLKTLKPHNGAKFLFSRQPRGWVDWNLSFNRFRFALFLAFWVNLFLVLLSCSGRFRTGVKYWKPLIKFQTPGLLTDKYAPDPCSLIKTNRPISLSPNKSTKFNSRYLLWILSVNCSSVQTSDQILSAFNILKA